MSTASDANPRRSHWRGRRLRLLDSENATAGETLDARLAAEHLPGLASEPARHRFVRELERSTRHIAAARRIAHDLGADARTPPFPVGWNPLPTIVHWWRDGDHDEAIWLAYLTTFFGPDERRGRELWYATRVLYGGFGERCVEWSRVVDDPRFLPSLCRRHADEYARLPRGNHRKNEPRLDVEHPRGLLGSAPSLVRPAEAHGGLATWFAGPDETAEERFDRLMHELFPLVSFGRTGRFDLLVLLGNLGVYELTPPRLYLEGSTGPLRGARCVLPEVRRIRALDDELTAVVHRVDVEVQAMEDALCNWQKH